MGRGLTSARLYPSLITLEKENLETFNHVDEMPILEMQENDWMRSCVFLCLK
jgi:hypothetical protein